MTYSLLDRLLIQANNAFATLNGVHTQSRGNPGVNEPDVALNQTESEHAAGLMRVNHTGEVCAQALYYGQMLVARDQTTYDMLAHAAAEETDHLAWCKQRLDELNSRPSFLNPLWYIGSLSLGVAASVAGDAWSLGFVEETEAQVSDHLAGHLQTLPDADLKSRAIVAKMKEDEERHGQHAHEHGARKLPAFIKELMKAQSKVMTTVAYRF